MPSKKIFLKEFHNFHISMAKRMGEQMWREPAVTCSGWRKMIRAVRIDERHLICRGWEYVNLNVFEI